MFERTIVIGNRKVVLEFSTRPLWSDGRRFVFGNPLGGELKSFSHETCRDALNNTPGHFLVIDIESDRVTLSNDITGGFRVYRLVDGENEYYSDSYSGLLRRIEERGTVEVDEPEMTYWRKHRYTTGGRTFIRRLDKLPPATSVKLTSGGTDFSRYFRNIRNGSDHALHTKHSGEALRRTIELCRHHPAPVILLFSGGADSTLLALMLKEAGVSYMPVFLRSEPWYDANYADYVKAGEVCKRLGVPMHIVTVSLQDVLRERAFVEPMLFDRHFSLLHFGGMRRLANTYGSDCLVIAGQGADNVLSMGPSSKTKGDLAARALLFSRSRLLRNLALFAVQRNYGQYLKEPESEWGRNATLLNPYRYYPLIDERDNHSLVDYIREITERVAEGFYSQDSFRMYLKLYSYMQGSDNQVLFRAASAAGIRNVVLPFCSPDLIYATVAFHDGRREVFHPKYVVYDLLKQFGFKLPTFHPTRTTTGMVLPVAEVEATVDKLFEEAVARLTTGYTTMSEVIR